MTLKRTGMIEIQYMMIMKELMEGRKGTFIIKEIDVMRSIWVWLILILVTLLATQSPYANAWLMQHRDSIEVLSAIAIILSAWFMAWQVRWFIKDYVRRNDRAEFDKSYQMAAFYSSQLLPRMAPVMYILHKANIQVDYDDAKRLEIFQRKDLRFTATEAISLFDEKICQSFLKCLQSEIPEEDLAVFFAAFDNTTSYELKKNWQEILAGASDKERTDFWKDKGHQLRQQMATVFNDMEYFSMVFCSNLAIPENVYASLHQTFLEFVSLGYLYIASRNKIPGHEYYTHIIALYHEWSLAAASTVYKASDIAKPKRLNKK